MEPFDGRVKIEPVGPRISDAAGRSAAQRFGPGPGRLLQGGTARGVIGPSGARWWPKPVLNRSVPGPRIPRAFKDWAERYYTAYAAHAHGDGRADLSRIHATMSAIRIDALPRRWVQLFFPHGELFEEPGWSTRTAAVLGLPTDHLKAGATARARASVLGVVSALGFVRRFGDILVYGHVPLTRGVRAPVERKPPCPGLLLEDWSVFSQGRGSLARGLGLPALSSADGRGLLAAGKRLVERAPFPGFRQRPSPKRVQDRLLSTRLPDETRPPIQRAGLLAASAAFSPTIAITSAVGSGIRHAVHAGGAGPFFFLAVVSIPGSFAGRSLSEIA